MIWDPVGVSDSAITAGEYESYVADVVSYVRDDDAAGLAEFSAASPSTRWACRSLNSHGRGAESHQRAYARGAGPVGRSPATHRRISASVESATSPLRSSALVVAGRCQCECEAAPRDSASDADLPGTRGW